jgi:hypothetical protein
MISTSCISTNLTSASLWCFATLFLCTAIWFALDAMIKIWVAKSTGKTIQKITYSGAGMKKIQVPLPDSFSASAEKTFKHCGNAPLALTTKKCRKLTHLDCVMPATTNAASLRNSPVVHIDWLRSGKPPPCRAPPEIFLSPKLCMSAETVLYLERALRNTTQHSTAHV